MYSIPQKQVSRDDKLLEYASYLVVDSYESLAKEKPNGVFFNKIMSLLNKKNENIKLPHYWYRYGDQVCRQKMPAELDWNHAELDQTKVDWKIDSKDHFKELEGHPIERDVNDLVEKYHDDVEKLIDDVYSYAPYKFQRKYLELRKTFYGINNAYNWDMESYKELSKPIFSRTFDDFPIHDFKELKDEYKLVKAFIDTKLESDDWKFRILEKISKHFWFLFCYHLRLNPEARENIPSEILHYWEEKLPNDEDRHRKSIADIIIDSIDKDEDLLENQIIEKFYDWRQKDKDETKKIIDDFVESYNKTSHSA